MGSTTLRVGIRCDASSEIGGGHVMRCLTLAEALSETGAKSKFVAVAMPDGLARRIVGAGHQLEYIPPSFELHRTGSEWEEPPLSTDTQLADANATGAAVARADWLIVDHYLLDARWHSVAREFADQILVIDDLANRSYDCDILLDQTLGRSAQDYHDLAPKRAKVLAGATYALLRPEFARERPAALERRKAGGPVRRIMVSMGTADPDGITARIVEQVLAAAPQCAIDVILGSQAASLRDVRELAAGHPQILIHVDSERMAELMRDADLAIGAAGTTSWERCCLGLPAVVLVLADNQRLAATNLEQAGAVIAGKTLNAISPLIERLINDEALRHSMIAAAAAVTDGHGARILARAMKNEAQYSEGELKLRQARPDDSSIAWLWRNDYRTRAFSQTTAPVPWSVHEVWWREALESPDRQLLIAEVAGTPAAVLRFDQIPDNGFDISINLASWARGHGLGKRILLEGCRTFLTQNKSARLLATIHRENPASRRIFEKVGFVLSDALSTPSFERYVLAEGNAE